MSDAVVAQGWQTVVCRREATAHAPAHVSRWTRGDEKDPGPVALVDDDPATRCALTRLLGAMGLATVSFASAEAFLAAGAGAGFSCLLLDIHLPGMSGLELRASLLETGLDLPTIFISAACDAEERVRASAGERALLLGKPLDACALGAALDTVRRADLPPA